MPTFTAYRAAGAAVTVEVTSTSDIVVYSVATADNDFGYDIFMPEQSTGYWYDQNGDTRNFRAAGTGFEPGTYSLAATSPIGPDPQCLAVVITDVSGETFNFNLTQGGGGFFNPGDDPVYGADFSLATKGYEYVTANLPDSFDRLTIPDGVVSVDNGAYLEGGGVGGAATYGNFSQSGVLFWSIGLSIYATPPPVQPEISGFSGEVRRRFT